MKVYFISTTYLKHNTVINENVEDSLINNAIIDAQNIHLQNILGTRLFKKLETLISTNTISASGNEVYKSLLDDYVVQMLVQWSLYEALPQIRYKVMNKSVSGQSSDNSTPVEPVDLKYFQSSVKDKAEFYSQRLADHLLYNANLYPEYRKATQEEMVGATKAYFSGLSTDDEDANAYLRTMGYNTNNITLNW